MKIKDLKNISLIKQLIVKGVVIKNFASFTIKEFDDMSDFNDDNIFNENEILDLLISTNNKLIIYIYEL